MFYVLIIITNLRTPFGQMYLLLGHWPISLFLFSFYIYLCYLFPPLPFSSFVSETLLLLVLNSGNIYVDGKIALFSQLYPLPSPQIRNSSSFFQGNRSFIINN